MENVSVLPLGSVVMGVKPYATPALIAVVGLPEIVGDVGEVGGLLGALDTTMLNAGSDAVSAPSETVMTMLP